MDIQYLEQNTSIVEVAVALNWFVLWSRMTAEQVSAWKNQRDRDEENSEYDHQFPYVQAFNTLEKALSNVQMMCANLGAGPSSSPSGRSPRATEWTTRASFSIRTASCDGGKATASPDDVGLMATSASEEPSWGGASALDSSPESVSFAHSPLPLPSSLVRQNCAAAVPAVGDQWVNCNGRRIVGGNAPGIGPCGRRCRIKFIWIQLSRCQYEYTTV